MRPPPSSLLGDPRQSPGTSDVSLRSGISGLSFDSYLLSLSLFSSSFFLLLFFLLFSFCLVLLLFLSCHFSANGPFSCLFFQKTLKYFSLSVRHFCMALVEQLGDDSWSVVCAACCHVALVFDIMHSYNIFKFCTVSFKAKLKTFLFSQYFHPN